MAKFKFNFGSDTSTTLFHNANASGNDFNMYTTCHAAGEAVFGNIRVSGTSQFGIICSDSCIHLIKSSGNAIIKSESGDNAGDLYLIGNRTSNNDTSNLTFYNSSEPIARIRAYRHGANDAGKLSFATQATGGNPVEHMTICPDGKVGIGTDSPDYLLDVEASSGYAYSRTVATANSQRALGIYQGKDGSGNVVDMRIGAIADATQGGIFTFTNHNLTFATNNASPQMTLTTGGNLSIGSTSSTYPLQAITNIADGTNPQIVARDLGTSDATVGFQIASAANWSIGIDNSDSDKFKIATGLDVGSNNIMTLTASGNVGIGTASPAVKLQVSGVICSSNCVKTPTVCSFNIGNDNTNTGTNAFVAGVCSEALGTCSSSFGTQTFACANYSTAVGHNVCALALDSNAFGLSTQACGSNSVAVGRSVITCNSKSSAFGYGSQARCDESLAMGFYAYGLGDRAIGIGYYSCADANYSIAVGYQAKTHAVNGSAYGRNSEACGTEATAVGNYTCATADDSSAFGYHAKATDIHTTAVGYCSCATEDHASAIGNRAQATAGWSIAVGYLSCTSGASGTSLGHQSCSQGSSNTAVGYCSSTNSDHTSAFGYKTCACGAQSSAFGYCSQARIGCTTNISTPLIHKKDSGETLAGDFAHFSSAESTLMTKEIDLKTTACHTITIPAGATFFINEAGVISTCVDTLTTQVTFKIGCATDATNTILENTQTTDLTAAKKRERYIPNNSEDGLQTITVEISTGASATTAKGRFYFKGMLVEDE